MTTRLAAQDHSNPGFWDPYLLDEPRNQYRGATGTDGVVAG